MSDKAKAEVWCKDCGEKMWQAPYNIMSFYCEKCKIKATVRYEPTPIIHAKSVIDEMQKKENEAYTKLRKMGYKVEMSEAYVPIDLRKYEIRTNRETIFKGDFKEFIEFTDEQDEAI